MIIELYLATVLTITGHPLKDVICDGRTNTVDYIYYDSTSAQIKILKEGYIKDDYFHQQEIIIWYFPESGVQWLQLTNRTKLEWT